MGIDTDLSTKTQYSIADGPFVPYNPALILGGLETGVTPLEMAHAYNTLAAGGQRVSGTMAANSGGPVGIIDVTDGGDCDCYQGGAPVPDETGANGVNKVVEKPVIDPGVATEASRSSRPSSRQGPGTWRRPATRPGARPAPPTTTATRGSAVRRRGSPPASGSGSRTP